MTTHLADMTPLPPVVLAALAGFGVTVMTGPLVRRLAIRFDLFDRPDAGLKPHETPVPYLGGLAIFFGWVAAIVVVAALSDIATRRLLTLALGGGALFVVGLIDDIRHIRPGLRLLAQFVVAAVLVATGIGGAAVADLLRSIGVAPPGAIESGAMALVLNTLFCGFVIAGATNSTNLVDGLDGLCAGVVAIAAIGFAVLLGLGHGGAPGLGDALVGALIGACAGFLVFNFNPASMFMGDSGSLLLGYSVGVVLIGAVQEAGWRTFACAAVVFGFPICDTALAIARRWRNGRPLFRGDRSHFYDQLRDRGLSVRRTVLTCYALAAGFAVVANLANRLPGRYLLAGLILGPLLLAMLSLRFGLLRVDDTAEQSGKTRRPS